MERRSTARLSSPSLSDDRINRLSYRLQAQPNSVTRSSWCNPPVKSIHVKLEVFGQTAQHLASLIAGGSLSLYSDQHGIQLKAAHGPVSVQAHSDAMQISADQSVKIISVNDTMHIIAQRITLTAADSQIQLDGANITFKTPGTFKVESSQQNNAPGAGQAGVPVALPKGTIAPQILAAEIPTLVQTYDEFFKLIDETTGEEIKNYPYEIQSASTGIIRNKTSLEGNTKLASTEHTSKTVTLHVEDEATRWKKKSLLWGE